MISFGLLLVATAAVASMFSMLASMFAFIIVRLLVWQESEFLVKCTTIFGTHKITEETK